MKQINFKSKLKGKVYTVNINLRTRITIISDLSGTGKTLVRKMAMKDCAAIVGYGSSDINSLKALLTSNSSFGFKGKVVVIDNAEKLLHEIPNLVDVINYDRDNYYLLFLRQTSFNIEATPNSQAKLAFNNETNTFSVEYVYEEGVWA